MLKALEDGRVDGFWANGMGAELAVRRGIRTVVLDVRRGDGPEGCFDHTWPAIATTDPLIARSPVTARAAVRAIVNTHIALKQNVQLAFEVGRKLKARRVFGDLSLLLAAATEGAYIRSIYRRRRM